MVAMAWWNPISTSELPAPAESEPEEKQQLKKVFKRAERATRKHKLYLQKNFRISELANRLGESSRIVSRAINLYAKGNFNSFVNEFRVRHAERLIETGKLDKYTMDAIADEAGFSNKVSFNKAFRSIIGMSPSEFRDKHS